MSATSTQGADYTPDSRYSNDHDLDGHLGNLSTARSGLHNTTALLALVQHMAEHGLPCNHDISVPTTPTIDSRLGVAAYSFQVAGWVRSGVVFTRHTTRERTPTLKFEHRRYYIHTLDGRLPCGVRIQLTFAAASKDLPTDVAAAAAAMGGGS